MAISRSHTSYRVHRKKKRVRDVEFLKLGKFGRKLRFFQIWRMDLGHVQLRIATWHPRCCHVTGLVSHAVVPS